MNRFLKVFKFKSSIFTRLFLVLLTAGVLIHILLGAFFEAYLRKAGQSKIIKNFKTYAEYLIEDIGYPPDQKRALQLSEKTGFKIIVSNPEDKIPQVDLPCRGRVKFYNYQGAKLARCRGSYIFQINKNGFTYTFVNKHLVSFEGIHYIIAAFLLTVVLVLAAAYFAIRKILKPVKLLHDGVKRISDGQLDYRIEVKKNDELGALTDSFNNMTERIQEMLYARDQLLRDVSHELRSPLTRIKVALEFLKDSDPKQNIEQDILEVEKMITEILESERLDNPNYKLELKNINVLKLLTEVIVENKFNKSRINLDDSLSNLEIDGDFEKLKIVFKNIIENSLKYSSETESKIDIVADHKNDKKIIRVTDYGVGIPAEELALIFEPFYRIDRSRSRKSGGYGLGLNICKKIIEAHGGTISMQSVEGKGSTVEIVL